MQFIIKAPSGDYLAPGERSEKPVNDANGIRYVTTYARQWTKEIDKARRFDYWYEAEATAGNLFWDVTKNDPSFHYMDTIISLDNGVKHEI